MQLIVVYFHGYGSNRNTSKVGLLRAGLPGANVHSFDIDIDPEIAQRNLETHIDSILLDNMHARENVIFVGTSLGAWWALKMARLYRTRAIAINPSAHPSVSLRKYGMPEAVCAKYADLALEKDNVLFFAERDEVIDHAETMRRAEELGCEVYINPHADHRFAAPHFNQIIDYIKEC